MAVSGLPFDDIRALFDSLPGPSIEAGRLVRDRNTALFGSAGAPGKLADVQVWLAEWSGVSPAVNRPMVAIFAGTHGTNSAEERSAVAERVNAVASGAAAVNQICGLHDLGLKVFDLALPYPAGDIRSEDALDEKTCAATIAFGMEAVAGGIDLLCLADCSGARAPSATALFAALHGGDPRDWSDDPVIGQTVSAALDRARGIRDPLELMRRLGGRETSALAGAILAARTQHIPVILDGAGPLAAAAVLEKAVQGAGAHCMAAQTAFSPQRQRMLEALGMAGIADFGSTIEEGEGAALAAVIAKSAALMHTETRLTAANGAG